MERLRGFLEKLFGAPEIKRQLGPIANDQQPPTREPDSAALRLRARPYRKGDFIGHHYEVCDVLGAGGFGVVYKVYSHEAHDIFAVKTFHDEFLNDENTREMFRKEAQLWIDMERHPHLVRAYYVEEISHRLYIVMEHVARGDTGLNALHEYLLWQPPDFAQSLRWAIQFCHGMEYAYSKGLRCHRDIKPSNIMVARDKTVKISDFGLAGITESPRVHAQTPRDRQRTSTGRSDQTIPVAGTVTHMPPEQFIDSASCDQRSDIYSFGIVLYQMASGKVPFDVPPPSRPKDENWGRTEIMWRLHSEAPVPPLNSKLFPLIQHCLEKKPQKRYQKFGELRKDLEALLESTNGEKIKPPTLEELKPWEWGNKGVSLSNLGRFEEALHCHNRAIELNPRSETGVKAWSNKALTLRALNRVDEALKCCDRALELDQTHIPTLVNEAVILADLGRYEASIECCDRILRLDPNDAKAWNNKGKALSSMRHFADALRCHDRAVELAPGDAQAWNNKGVALKDLGRFEEALSCYDRALQIDLRDPRAWTNKALAEEKLGRIGDAVNAYEQLILVADANSESQVEYARKRLSELKGGRNV